MKYIFSILLSLLLLIPPMVAQPNRNLSVEQDAVLSCAELYLVHYLEAKMKNIGHIKFKLRQLVHQVNNRGDYVVLEQVYETLGGLLIVYKDKYLHDLYFEVKAMLDAHAKKPRVDASTLVGIQEQ